MICRVLAMEMLQGVWKQHLRPRAVVGYDVKIFLPSPPNYVSRSPGGGNPFFFSCGRTSAGRLTRCAENNQNQAKAFRFNRVNYFGDRRQ